MKRVWLLFALASVGCARDPLHPQGRGEKELPPQATDEGADYTFPVGSKWTYSTRRVEKDGTFTIRVTKSENGCSYLSYEGHERSGESSGTSEEMQWIGDGGLCSATIRDGKALGGQMEYKLGSKKGDRWVNCLGDTTAEHQGRVEVQVPAGTYKDAIHIRVLSDADGRIVYESWLVPKVGLVKMTAESHTIELEKFEKPSK